MPDSTLCFAFEWQHFSHWMERVVWHGKFSGASSLEKFLQFKIVSPHRTFPA